MSDLDPMDTLITRAQAELSDYQALEEALIRVAGKWPHTNHRVLAAVGIISAHVAWLKVKLQEAEYFQAHPLERPPEPQNPDILFPTKPL